MDPKVTLPPIIYSSLRAASGSWVADTDFNDAPSPFRAENLDLLQRELAWPALTCLDRLRRDSFTPIRNSRRHVSAWHRHPTLLTAHTNDGSDGSDGARASLCVCGEQVR